MKMEIHANTTNEMIKQYYDEGYELVIIINNEDQ